MTKTTNKQFMLPLNQVSGATYERNGYVAVFHRGGMQVETAREIALKAVSAPLDNMLYINSAKHGEADYVHVFANVLTNQA